MWGTPIVTKWDSNGDGELSYTEAAAITDIGQVFGWIANFANIHGEYGWWLPVSFDEFQFFTGVKTISNGAFGSISSITLPKSVTTIEEGALSGLSCVSVDEENPSFAMINNALCTKDGSQLIKALSNNIEGEYTIPSTVKNILVEAFSNCYNMRVMCDIIDKEN